MAKIKSDSHGLYFIYNGSVWRPIIPENEKSIADARKMLPENLETLIGETAHPKSIESFFVHITINEIDYMWYNHGIKRMGVKSDYAYRDFEQEDIEIKALIESGLTQKEAYSVFWKTLI